MQRRNTWLLFTCICIFIFSAMLAFSAPIDYAEIQKMVQSFKTDLRGPYQAIRWFYPDGSTYPPRSPATDKTGGLQHALHKDIVSQIRKEHGIYLGQILAGTKNGDFLDTANQNSRMKQYQMEQYLRAVDDGWIFRRVQYYRGAFQAEDEEEWGINFLKWLLSKDDVLASQFFLCRQVAQDIPHAAKDSGLTRIRSLAENISCHPLRI